MFLSGYVISELFFIGSPNGHNNAGWFYIQSLMACWFLLFMFLVSIEDRKTVYITTIIGLFLLASPSTIQFLSLRSSDDYVEFSQDDLRIIEHLRESDRRSVVIHPLNHDRPSLASNFAGRSTVLSVWVSFVTDSSGLYERADDVMLFFNKESNSSQRKTILEKYEVDYVLGSEPELTFMEEFPGAILELKSGDQMLYRVRGPD